jgi:hypothetical protein
MLVGAYFSKADWHSHSFWDPSIGFPTTRNTNYNTTTNASKWADFVAFNKAQFDELQAQYNPDLYWLDANWVGGNKQFLPLADWASEYRKINPDQLWVNRDSNGVVEVTTPYALEEPKIKRHTETQLLTASSAFRASSASSASSASPSASPAYASDASAAARSQDYLTPENPPPSSLTAIGLGLRPKPWEVCMPLGKAW